MTPHRALIVDDERLARRELAYLLREHPQIHVVAEASSVDDAVTAIERTHPELVFLDVQMPGGSGFELFGRTRMTARVIFVTAHDAFALRAFEVNALDYLMKPINPTRLAEAIERFLTDDKRAPANRLSYDDSIFLPLDHAARLVPLSSIVCILAEGDYTRLVSTSGSLGLVLKSMKEWEAVLPDKKFARIQRSAIINCTYLARLVPWFNGAYQAHLQNVPEPIPMSRRYARLFRSRFGV